MYGGPLDYPDLQNPVIPLGPGLEFDNWVRLSFNLLSARGSMLTLTMTSIALVVVPRSGRQERTSERRRSRSSPRRRGIHSRDRLRTRVHDLRR